MLTASERFALNFSLSSGSANDSPQGMRLLFFTPPGKQKQYLLMDRAYSGKKMREIASLLGYEPVVPSKRSFKEQWEYDKELYKRRNEIERFFRRLKAFRRIFTRYDKLDIVFAGFILFVMIVDSLVWTRSSFMILFYSLIFFSAIV